MVMYLVMQVRVIESWVPWVRSALATYVQVVQLIELPNKGSPTYIHRARLVQNYPSRFFIHASQVDGVILLLLIWLWQYGVFYGNMVISGNLL